MMFEGGGGRGEDAAQKRSSRRETWCPGGKGGWQAPAGAGEWRGRGLCLPRTRARAHQTRTLASCARGTRTRMCQGCHTCALTRASPFRPCPPAAEAFNAANLSAATRKRSLNTDGTPAAQCAALGDEDEAAAGAGSVGDGPTPQRPRRAGAWRGRRGGGQRSPPW